MKRFFQTSAFSPGDLVDLSSGGEARPRSPEVTDPLTRDQISARSGEITDVASPTIVRIAVYDSMTATPRVEEVYGDSGIELIDRLSARVYQIAREAGGPIPYVVVRELSENLLHAGFADVIVSVMDGGHTIRVSDSGPGIRDVGRALMPGFSTATQAMRDVIRGVGSGLPIAAECMRFAGGGLVIDSNLHGGTVVTAFVDEATARSVASPPMAAGPAVASPSHEDPFGRSETPTPKAPESAFAEVPVVAGSGLSTTSGDPVVPVPRPAPAARQLSTRQKQTLLLVMEIGSVGPTTVSRELTVALSTAHRDLALLEAEGLITADPVGKRKLTPLGVSYVESLF